MVLPGGVANPEVLRTDSRVVEFVRKKTDLKNAGAEWVDHEVVVDGNLVKRRKPDDLPAFCHEAIGLILGTGSRAQPAAE